MEVALSPFLALVNTVKLNLIGGIAGIIFGIVQRIGMQLDIVPKFHVLM
jgi:hypothetical protein